MQVLFTFVGGQGHFDPLVPLACAAVEAGHLVTVACRRSMIDAVRGAGFAALAIGPDVPDPSAMRPLVALDPAHEERVLAGGFAEITAAHRARDLVSLVAESALRPDLIVSDEVDFGASIAAEVLHLPHATVIVLAAGGFARTDLLAAPLNRVRARFGLAADPFPELPERSLVLAPQPPSFRDPAFPLPSRAVPIRPATSEASAASPWPHDDRPHVHITLGTIFNMESGDLFSRLLDAVDDLDAAVLVTVGRSVDPATFGSRPDHVDVRDYVPQASVLPGADLVVCHGGSGSVIGALAHGVPLVVLPLGGDQPHNGRRVKALGVGRALDPVLATPATIRAAIDEVLTDPSYRRRAEALRNEAMALPDAPHAVTLLEAHAHR